MSLLSPSLSHSVAHHIQCRSHAAFKQAKHILVELHLAKDAGEEAAAQPGLGQKQTGTTEGSVSGLLGIQHNIQPMSIQTPGNGAPGIGDL